MKLDARQLVSRILPGRREDDPPPPYSPRDMLNPAPAASSTSPGLPLTRSISPRYGRPLPTPPGGAEVHRSVSSGARIGSHSQSHSYSHSPYQQAYEPLSPHSTNLNSLAFEPQQLQDHSTGSHDYQPRSSSQNHQPHPSQPTPASTYLPPSGSRYAHRRSMSGSGAPPNRPSQAVVSPQPRRLNTAHLRGSPPRPSPPYMAEEDEPRGRSSLHTLPIALTHRVLMLALDPVATPDAWNWDVEMERVRRLHWLFRDFRAVDRRFFLIATSILRDRLMPTYNSLLQVRSSSPLPPPGVANATKQPVYASRSRETAVLDRFVSMRLGEDLRRAESALSEDSGEEDVLFSRLQPAARVEDLLLRLPPSLITPSSSASPSGNLPQRLPLPHAHVAVTLGPRWAQLWLSYSPVNQITRGGRAGRSLVVEVRKEAEPEDMVRAFGQALEGLRAGRIGWGWSFRTSI